MKIKIAILEQDEHYLTKITSVFNTRFSGKLEVFGFSNPDIALQQLSSICPDLFLFPESFLNVIDLSSLRIVPLVLVESNDITEVKGCEVVSKYQKADQIYKKILAVYSAHTDYSFISDTSNLSCKTIVYTGIAGGVGTTTVALSCAFYLAKMQKRVVYLDLNPVSSLSVFLTGEGDYCMSDILYAIKSKKGNIGLKLESTLCQDASGVSFFKEAATMLDMIEMTDEEAVLIWQELCGLEVFDYVIIDMPFKLRSFPAELMTKSQYVIWVSDGSVSANTKMLKAYQAVKILEEQGAKFRIHNLSVVYNAFSSKTGKVIEDNGLKNLGGVPKVQNASERQVVEHISNMELFKPLFEEM